MFDCRHTGTERQPHLRPFWCWGASGGEGGGVSAGAAVKQWEAPGAGICATDQGTASLSRIELAPEAQSREPCGHPGRERSAQGAACARNRHLLAGFVILECSVAPI